MDASFEIASNIFNLITPILSSICSDWFINSTSILFFFISLNSFSSNTFLNILFVGSLIKTSVGSTISSLN